MEILRICDFGRVSARRSQTLWHALAEGVSAGGPATLAFMRPARAYVGLGYHRHLAEVDIGWCREAALPIYRRKAGGGVVYLDDGQLFFQIILPASSLPAWRPRAETLRGLLEPAVDAWQAAGVDAHLDEAGEVVVGEAKVCGHAAAQVDDAVVVVGNLIERFDHAAATRVLALPPEARTLTETLMHQFVAATPADPEVFRKAAIENYGAALGCEPVPGRLNAAERHAVERLDRQFSSAAWRHGPVAARPLPAGRLVKIRAGVGVVVARAEAARLCAALIGGRLETVTFSTGGIGAAHRWGAALQGLTLSEARTWLAEAGPGKQELALALGSVRAPAD